MRRSEEFRLTVRSGIRSGRPTVVGHLLLPSARDTGPAPLVAAGTSFPALAAPARVGLVVSRAVGPAVTRNLVKRRLRELMRGYLHSLPGGSLLVLRANPAAGRAHYPDLAADLDMVMTKLLRRQRGAHVGNAS